MCCISDRLWYCSFNSVSILWVLSSSILIWESIAIAQLRYIIKQGLFLIELLWGIPRIEFSRPFDSTLILHFVGWILGDCTSRRDLLSIIDMREFGDIAKIISRCKLLAISTYWYWCVHWNSMLSKNIKGWWLLIIIKADLFFSSLNLNRVIYDWIIKRGKVNFIRLTS